MLKKIEKLKKLVAIILTFSFVFSVLVFSSSEAFAVDGTWKSDETGWWYEYASGNYPRSKWLEINGYWYYFLVNGYLKTNGYWKGYWLGETGEWDPAYSNGHWCSDSNGWWFEDAGWYPTSQWLNIDDRWYYFKVDGYMATDCWIDGCYLNDNGNWVPDFKSGSGNSLGLYATGDSHVADDDFPFGFDSRMKHSYDKIASVDGIDFVRAYSKLNDRYDYDWGIVDYLNGYGTIHYYLYVSKEVDSKDFYVIYNGDEGFRDFGNGYAQYIPNANAPVAVTYAKYVDDNEEMCLNIRDMNTNAIRCEYMAEKGYKKYIDLEIQHSDSGKLSFDFYYKDTKLTTISVNSEATAATVTEKSNTNKILSDVLKYKSNMTDSELISASCYWIRQQNYNDGYTCWSCHGVADIMKTRNLSSVALSCSYQRGNGIENVYGSYYSLSPNRRVTNGDENSIGHRICLIFTDSSHYAFVQVEGNSGHFMYKWEPEDILVSSIYNKVEFLRDYDTVYDMVKGDYGIDLKTFDPLNCKTWY